jgi:dsDNA-binding SOS-regulon protein
MLIRHVSRATTGIPGVSKRHRGKPRENPSNTNNGKPANLHDVHKLAGHVAALSRFVARLGEKALPFYALMKKSDSKFEWTEEADTAFAQLKKVLSTPPVLVAPKEREPLLLYVAATHQVVSTVLVVEQSEEGKAHV